MSEQYEKIKAIRTALEGINEDTSTDIINDKLRLLNAELKKDDYHFTYKYPDKTKLKQGDILSKSDELNKILKEVHPYYNHDKYKYFIILTQSCDLPTRDSSAKAKYITLAAIRTFDDFLNKEISVYQKTELEKKARIIPQKAQAKLYDTISKLYNNNHHDFFYLHEDPTINFSSSVAFLRLSISLKIEHYQICLNAKHLQLKEEFIAKLGWLVGDLYSRVGTQDWVPNTYNDKQFGEWVNTTIKSNCAIVSSKRLDDLKREYSGKEISDIPAEEIITALSKIKEFDYKSQFNTKMGKLLTDCGFFESKEQIETLLKSINSSNEIMSCIKG